MQIQKYLQNNRKTVTDGNIVFPYDVAQFDSITEPFREKNNNIPEPESAEMGTKKMFHTLGKIYKRNHYSVARRDGTTINGLFDDGRKYPENILNGDLKIKYENSVIDKQIHPDIEKESPTDNKQKDKKDKKGKSKSKRKKDKDQVKTLPINNSKNKDRNSTFRDILPKRNYVSKSVSIRNRSKSLDLLNIYKDKDIKSPHEVSLKLERPGDVIYPTNAGKERVERSHSLDFLDHIPDSFLDNYPERDYPNEDEHDSEKKNQYEYDEADFVFGDDSGRNSPKDSSSLNRPPSVRGDFYDHVAGTVFSDNSNLLTVEHKISRSEHESPYAAVMKGGIKPSLIVSDVDNKSPVYDVEISKSPTAGVFSYQLANDNEEIIEGQSPRSPAHKYLFEHQVTIDESIYSTVNDLRITTSSREPEKYHTFKLMKHYKSLGLSICGGSDSKSQHDIKIGIIHPDSAASQTNLKVGQILVSVDGESLLDVTHKEAVNLIRALYRDKTKPHMELVVADAV